MKEFTYFKEGVLYNPENPNSINEKPKLHFGITLEKGIIESDSGFLNAPKHPYVIELEELREVFSVHAGTIVYFGAKAEAKITRNGELILAYSQKTEGINPVSRFSKKEVNLIRAICEKRKMKFEDGVNKENHAVDL